MLWLACVNLFGVSVGIIPRATMRVAPDEPQNDGGFVSAHSCFRFLVGPLCRSRHQVSAVAKRVGILGCVSIETSLQRCAQDSSVEAGFARGNRPRDPREFVSQCAGHHIGVSSREHLSCPGDQWSRIFIESLHEHSCALDQQPANSCLPAY